jgi:hypothetical protein
MGVQNGAIPDKNHRVPVEHINTLGPHYQAAGLLARSHSRRTFDLVRDTFVSNDLLKPTQQALQRQQAPLIHFRHTPK